MYTVYNYNANTSAANIQSDVIALLTGETNKANLSSACNQANTNIISTVPAGWTVWDGSAGGSPNRVVIRAQNQDGTTYKYLKFCATTTAAFETIMYESWNTSTHVGTNPTNTGSGIWDGSGGGYLFIYATSKNIVMVPWTATGFQTPYTGLIVSEFSRITIPSTYPCAGLYTTYLYIPKYKNPTANGDLTNKLTYFGGLIIGAINLGNYKVTYRDTSENIYIEGLQISAYDTSVGLNIGNIYDIYYSGNSVNILDEITIGATTYVVIYYNAVASLLVPKA